MTEQKEQPALHMGRLVRSIARMKGLNATTLAPLLEISPGGVSQLFRKQALHTTLLLKLGDALNHDFFAHLCQCPKDGEATGEMII